VDWSADNQYLYLVDHQEDPSISNQELSPIFNLHAYDLDRNQKLQTAMNVGMFAYPKIINSEPGENKYQLIYLQAIFPESSESSRYRLMSSDRDGSNTRTLFPSEDMQGLEPQNIVKSPCEDESACQIGFLYQGNLWISTLYPQFTIHQITGDGLITQIEWK
jgi:hypothetical protein